MWGNLGNLISTTHPNHSLLRPRTPNMAEEAEAPVVAPEPVAAPVAAPELTLTDSIKAVLLKARVHDGLKRGLHECAKILDRKQARVCFLASNCNVDAYKKLVKALCDANEIPLIEVETHQLLGEWCGLCKLDKEGKARKVAKCSVAVITDFGEPTAESQFVLNHVKKA